MHPYQQRFIEFILRAGVLSFGEFTLKSGRKSPYFFNAGLFNSGVLIGDLGAYYAETLVQARADFDLLFGPAYKGIPLAVAASIALARDYKRDAPFAFNRKEAKDHGEGGTLVGASLKGKKVLIVDDVISAGTSVRESLEIIAAAGGTPAGIIIALDRQERGKGAKSTLQEIRDDMAIPVYSIITLGDILEHLCTQGDTGTVAQIEGYLKEYGAA